jgi:Cu-processing system ATP-binding protein
MFHPEIIILDEPTAGLDPLASEILKNKIIKERKNGKLIIITSHLLSELDDMVNEIVFINEGKVFGTSIGGRFKNRNPTNQNF